MEKRTKIYTESSGVSRKFEQEETKCQKFTGNEIHWERIPPLLIPLGKFFVLNISKDSQKIGWALNFSTLRAEGASEKFISNLWMKVTKFIRLRCDNHHRRKKSRILGRKISFFTIKRYFFYYFGELLPLYPPPPPPLATPMINSYKFVLIID